MPPHELNTDVTVFPTNYVIFASHGEVNYNSVLSLEMKRISIKWVQALVTWVYNPGHPSPLNIESPFYDN